MSYLDQLWTWAKTALGLSFSFGKNIFDWKNLYGVIFNCKENRTRLRSKVLSLENTFYK